MTDRRGASGRRFDFAGGSVLISADGAVAAVVHPSRGHSMLLREDPDAVEAVMHEPARRWGKGFVITEHGGRRFDTPQRLEWTSEGVQVAHDLGRLSLRITRRIADTWTETYELRNVSLRPVAIGSIAVSTPWRDVYGSSRESLEQAVHAHIWTGGADAWVWAVPMDGSGPGLGLRLTEGELWGYSVESRDAFTGSNLRGHLYLHVTDHARAPHAMGGQPRILLGPGQVVRWSWQLNWYPTLADLRAAGTPLIEADGLVAEVGQPLPVRLGRDATTSAPNPVTSETPGIRHIIATAGRRRSRISVLFHPPLKDLVEQRVRFALDRQRPVERAGSRRAAFVPYDNDAGLTVLPGAWRDWSDVRERVGTAQLLQETLRRGWGDPAELSAALADYQRFIVEHVVDPDGTVSDDTVRPGTSRLYNFPWYARFLLGQRDVDRAVRILDRYYASGGEHYLAFDLGPLLHDLGEELRADGRPDDAARMGRYLTQHAATFLRYGTDLPPHEVNYEQSMVAPLLELLIAAHRLRPDVVPAAELDRRLPWLTAFAADQPDVRLRHIPIRHWDGYWFGRQGMWGDVFPHYWSVLSASVFLTWPDDVADRESRAGLRAAGDAILRSNLCNFNADGSATCAFIYPTCVNGRPAHVADPLANDQDWALVYALRLGLS